MSNPTGRRDKFAALAQQQTTGATTPDAPKRGDKFASLKQTVAETPRRDKFAAVQLRKKTSDRRFQQSQLKSRCQQRDEIWNDLDKAEACVIHLLGLAEQTAQSLADQTTSKEETKLLQYQRDYQSTLSDLHDYLADHSDLIQAYEAPQGINRIYLQRVEHRLAESKLNLLKEFVSEEEGQMKRKA